jgi:cysteine desulfurase / selenocysteine lyase
MINQTALKSLPLDKIDIINVRDQLIGLNCKVPLLDGSETIYINFDNAASTPTFNFIFERIGEYLQYYSNVHRGTGLKSLLSSHVYEKGREMVAEFVNANLDDSVIIFTKNSTEALNRLARRYPFEKGDIVLTSLMEHHSNELPWRRAEYDHVGLNPDGTLNLNDLELKLKMYNGRVKIVALTGASNVTGYINPIDKIARMVHAAGAEILIDAAQIAPHRPIDMQGRNKSEKIDYLVLSAHKMYAPFGIGVLVGNKRIFEFGDPDIVGGGVVDIVTLEEAYWSDLPEKEEAGTPDIVGVVALAEAIKMFRQIGWKSIIQHEAELTSYLLTRLNKLDRVTVYGDSDPANSINRLGVVPFNVDGVPHALLAAILSYEGGIGVRNGCFCAHTYVKYLLDINEKDAKKLESEIKLRDRSNIPGTVRASFGIYNTKDEIDRMCNTLEKIISRGFDGKYTLNREKGIYLPDGYNIDLSKFFDF